MERMTAHLSGNRDLEYVDTGGPGPVVLLLHGALMDEGLWEPVIERLVPRHRCVVPVLPLGAHRRPMPEGSDVSPAGVAALLVEFVEELGLHECVLVGNDTGGAIAQLALARRPNLVAGLVLASCDAYENFPPGLPGRTMALAAAIPGGLRLAMLSMRCRPLRRLPMTYGWMTRKPIDEAVFSSWLDGFEADAEVRRDLVRFLRGIDRHQLKAAARGLSEFAGPALVVWATHDLVMPPAHAHALSDDLRRAPIVWVERSRTLVPLDRPDAMADAIEQVTSQVHARLTGGRSEGFPKPS